MTTPLRILQFIPDGWPTYRPDVAVLFGKALPAEGVATDLVAVVPEGAEAGAPWAGGALIGLRTRGGRLRRQMGEAAGCLRVLARLGRGDCDALQVRDKPFLAALALLKARRLGVPFFYWMSFPMAEAAEAVARTHGLSLGLARYVFLRLRGTGGRHLLYRFVLPRADHVFVQSERMLDDVAALGIARERMTAVPMCVDPERFTGPAGPADPALDAALAGRRVIAYLGTCERVRRIDVLFETLAILRRTVPDAFLLVVGDAIEAEDRAWLDARIRDCGVEGHVLRTGWLPSAAAQAAMARAEVALAPMAPDPLLDSTTPTKLVEYLAMGLPVVANAHPDQSRVLAESGAGLCTAFEPETLAAAAARLLGDGDMRRAMGAAGPAYVLAQRSYPAMAARLAARYRALVGAPAGAAGGARPVAAVQGE
ncbi:glycosyltransferase [Prosthecomicrobium sp. N25]|uniref:glycosyltransferase n=1 Tax=Prosthecomicrobium sp. N25 TaxID=3129254 RepID=UPI003076BEC0